ncbi:cytochrome P450 2B4-like [Sciurus carolinensis]|uniref:cytochrome P450 2B4-like n=1 Tax=Sciurus carolinensis TaxID=30640 RepID=UPI001FB20E35|nr:cytochrome P450 2B4-like [Sciurus carolinensis]
MVLSSFPLFIVLISLFLLWIWGRPNSKGRLPPGPWPLPFLGNILQIDSKGFLKTFKELREKYGDVFTVHLGPRPVIILCGYEAIREALVHQAETFSGRGLIAITDSIFQGTGVSFANGKSWKVLQRFCLTTMKDFGMGKRSIEERIKEEAQNLVEELWKSQGTYLDPTLLFHSVTANIICSIIFDERFNYQDPKFLRLLSLLNQAFTILSSFYSQVFELLSGILKHFPGPHTHLCRIIQELKDFITENIERHQETLDPSAPRDFIDSFLLRMDKERFVPESEFHYKNLVHTVLSLFFAGTETSSTTLRYALLLLLKHPDVLEEVQAEIDRVVGSKRLPALEDRAKMPYTDAVIHEIQRYSDLVPIGIPHSVIQDTNFRGYHLPKNTTVYPVMNSVLHDPRHFEKPDTFYPGHFLDAKGNFRKREAFIPFSMGKRICLGESLARSELFLFLTSMLQSFSLGCPKAPEDIDLTPQVNGLGKSPPVFQLCFLPRHREKEEMQISSGSFHVAPTPEKNEAT